MSLSRILFVVLASLLPIAAFAGAHDSAGEAPSCADLQFTSDILQALPEANAACREVVVKDGKPYARFSAEIVRNRAGILRAKFKRADGSWTDVYEFRPDPSARVHVAGRSYLWRDIQRGQQLDIYLPPDRFEIATHDDAEEAFAATEVAIVMVTVTRAPREELPTTASILPLVGGLGALLVALGAGIGVFRRRLG